MSYPEDNRNEVTMNTEEMNALNRETSPAKPPPDLIRNLVSDEYTEKCNDKCLLADYEKEGKEGLPWSTTPPGELVVGRDEDYYNRRKKQRRKVKRAFGWVFWIACLPLAGLSHFIRDKPEDEDDLQDDPLRPWSYNVSPSAEITCKKDS